MTTSAIASAITGTIIYKLQSSNAKRVYEKSLNAPPVILPFIFKSSKNIYYFFAFGIIFTIVGGTYEALTHGRDWIFSAILISTFVLLILLGIYVFMKESLEITRDRLTYITISSKDVVQLSEITDIVIDPFSSSLDLTISSKDKPLKIMLIFENSHLIVSTLRELTKFPIDIISLSDIKNKPK
jgi:hypothetical protein